LPGWPEAGDQLVCPVGTTSRRTEHRFERLEVNEVFTAVPPSRMEGAMRAWNGIADRNPVDFDEFLEGLRRPCPLRMEQRKAADAVIDAINRKPVWPSCRNPLERYGYGNPGGRHAALVRGLDARNGALRRAAL